jgi:hypothetical protein
VYGNLRTRLRTIIKRRMRTGYGLTGELRILKLDRYLCNLASGQLAKLVLVAKLIKGGESGD